MWRCLLPLTVCLTACTDRAATGDSGDDTGSTGLPDCEALPASIEIGTGEFAFIEVEPHDEITMVHGPQGGWHMLGSVRTENMAPNLRIHFSITDLASGELISDNEYFVQQVATGVCTGEVVGRYGYLNLYDDLKKGEDDTPWELFSCHEVRYDMEVTDPTWGKKVAESLTVVAVPDKKDAPNDC